MVRRIYSEWEHTENRDIFISFEAPPFSFEHTTIQSALSPFTNCCLLHRYVFDGQLRSSYCLETPRGCRSSFFGDWSTCNKTSQTQVHFKHTLNHDAHRPDIQYSMCVGWLASNVFPLNAKLSWPASTVLYYHNITVCLQHFLSFSSWNKLGKDW